MQGGMIISVAEVAVSIRSSEPIERIRLDPTDADFVSTGEPALTVEAHYDGLPQVLLRAEDQVFDSGTVWSLYRVDGRNVFVLRTPPSNPQPYRIAIFDAGYRQGTVYSQAPAGQLSPDGLLSNPLEYPLSAVLMVCLLAQERGIMVHACGIDDGGRGYLFAGNSTHGKSTTARLWKGRGTVLNDDRIVLRERDGRFWMYGTPWHGDYDSVSPAGVPLEKIFFLNHDTTNNATPRSGVVAASKLLARAFPPLWDEPGMAYTLGLLDRLVTAVPCFDLGFVPGAEAVDFVRCVT